MRNYGRFTIEVEEIPLEDLKRLKEAVEEELEMRLEIPVEERREFIDHVLNDPIIEKENI